MRFFRLGLAKCRAARAVAAPVRLAVPDVTGYAGIQLKDRGLVRRSANAISVTAPGIAPIRTQASGSRQGRTAMIYVGVITILVLIAGLGWSVLKLVDNFGKTGGEM